MEKRDLKADCWGMNRDILFRGKRLDNGEWVYGYLVVIDGVAHITENVFTFNFFMKVDPETVGQYTGLKDKNGVKIFEGDTLGGIVGGGVVVWINRETRYGISLLEEVHDVYLEELEQADLEVIGNIHDNPEPLEVLGE